MFFEHFQCLEKIQRAHKINYTNPEQYKTPRCCSSSFKIVLEKQQMEEKRLKGNIFFSHVWSRD